MARKRKGELPSGNIRIQVYDYTDAEGKRHYQSFTAASKKEAQAKAQEWKQNRRSLKEQLTVSEACERYISLKEGVLSPYTITGYRTALKRIEKHQISRISMSCVSNTDVQLFVSDLSMKVAPKTVYNTYGLVSSAFKTFIPDMKLHITLPAKKKAALYIPNSDDIQRLLDSCKTTELKLAILFAAVGTMRRGEACAVTFKDVDFDKQLIAINKSFVKVEDLYWELKEPKTYESNRKIRMPKYVFDMIKTLGRKEGYVINLTPDQLYDRFMIALNKSGLPHFRYHDLRHYAASSMHAAGVPERYIEAIGGWKPGSNILKRIYENVIDSELYKIEENMAEKNAFNI